MKINIGLIKLVLLTILVGVLFSFTKNRNKQRKITAIDVEFIDENSPFITLNKVNKLLIQNEENVTNMAKETLVLSEMEQRLQENPMVREAQVFVTVNGVLGARIEQRNPIARVTGSPDFYLDADGTKMPLSPVYTARVPLMTGTSNTYFAEVTPLLLAINEDVFMQRSVVGLNVEKDGEITLKVRKHNFIVRFGKPEEIKKKFQNFKAFYQKTKQDSTLYSYELIDLRFGNQVVATKK